MPEETQLTESQAIQLLRMGRKIGDELVIGGAKGAPKGEGPFYFAEYKLNSEEMRSLGIRLRDVKPTLYRSDDSSTIPGVLLQYSNDLTGGNYSCTRQVQANGSWSSPSIDDIVGPYDEVRCSLAAIEQIANMTWKRANPGKGPIHTSTSPGSDPFESLPKPTAMTLPPRKPGAADPFADLPILEGSGTSGPAVGNHVTNATSEAAQAVRVASPEEAYQAFCHLCSVKNAHPVVINRAIADMRSAFGKDMRGWDEPSLNIERHGVDARTINQIMSALEAEAKKASAKVGMDVRNVKTMIDGFLESTDAQVADFANQHRASERGP